MEAIEESTTQRPSAEWIAALNEAGVPCGPIYKLNETFADPQVKHLGMAAATHHHALGDIEVVAQGVRLSNTPFKVRSAAPDLGDHTDEVLRELGYKDGENRRFSPTRDCLIDAGRIDARGAARILLSRRSPN